MSQVTIYVPEKEARVMREAARREKRSVSEWARERLSGDLQESWPPGYFDLLGSLRDESLKRPTDVLEVKDSPREPL